MAETSAIEWTDATWNPITGCSVVSPGCTNCYAMGLAGTRLKRHPSRAGLTVDTKAGPVWNGQVRLNEAWLTQPLEWKRARRIFVCAHGDLFAEGVPDAWIDRVFAVMALCPQHTFQVLTKRAARMRAYLSAARAHPVGLEAMDIALHEMARNPRSDVGSGCILQGDICHLKVWPLPNVWLGVSAEDQRRADERVPDLQATPAAVRFVSAEPLLGPIDFSRIPVPESEGRAHNALYGHEIAGMVGQCISWVPPLDWIIVGGESGPAARKMHPAWARSIRDQCDEAGVAFFFKQWGEWVRDTLKPGGDLGGDLRSGLVAHVCSDRENDGHFRKGDIYMRRVGKKAAGRLLDGVEHNGMPEVRA